jgi:uncharacterized glyoxalase superfamily protein PhnB
MSALTSFALSLRVPDVQAAAAFYQRLGFHYVMAVPDDAGAWVLCLLRHGTSSILLGAHDHSHFPPARYGRSIRSDPRLLGAKITLSVPDLDVTYDACVAAGCEIRLEPMSLWGERLFICRDPFGYEWQFAQQDERMRLESPWAATEAAWS